jgi:hypothetical protein
MLWHRKPLRPRPNIVARERARSDDASEAREGGRKGVTAEHAIDSIAYSFVVCTSSWYTRNGDVKCTTWQQGSHQPLQPTKPQNTQAKQTNPCRPAEPTVGPSALALTVATKRRLWCAAALVGQQGQSGHAWSAHLRVGWRLDAVLRPPRSAWDCPVWRTNAFLQPFGATPAALFHLGVSVGRGDNRILPSLLRH